MKKIMTLVAVMAMAANISASNNSVSNTSNETLRLAPFTEVNVNVPARIKIVQGKDYGVMANSANDCDLNLLDYQVRNGVLYISTQSKDIMTTQGRGTMIIITTPATDTAIKTGDDVQPIRRK